MIDPIAPVVGWTCPFCALLCDEFELAQGAALELRGSDCPRARAALAAHRPVGAAAGASVDAAPASIDAAVAAAAQRLARWQRPVFGGLDTDLEGARALHRLAVMTGAICDTVDGDALFHGLRALQDRGQASTTLGEVRSRADLLVCVGTRAIERHPEFFRRCGLGQAGSACSELVFLGVAPPPGIPAGVAVRALPGSGDLFADVQQLAALLAPRGLAGADPELAALAQRLRAARYSVLVWEGATLPAHGALVVEALQRIAASLNATSRAGTLALAGSPGPSGVNHVLTWRSGLPLRTRAAPEGPEHDPVRFAGARMLAERAADGLLWISSFDAARLPPTDALDSIVLGPPSMAPALARAGRGPGCVFVPVATPGVNADGHLLRTDGGIVVPVTRARDDGLAGVADVLHRLADLLGPSP
jgi:formylmethanofuran dehydrogenase subunit B